MIKLLINYISTFYFFKIILLFKFIIIILLVIKPVNGIKLFQFLKMEIIEKTRTMVNNLYSKLHLADK